MANLQDQLAGAELQLFTGGHNFRNQDPKAFRFIADTLERFASGI
jgi:hypothetical protein